MALTILNSRAALCEGEMANKSEKGERDKRHDARKARVKGRRRQQGRRRRRWLPLTVDFSGVVSSHMLAQVREGPRALLPYYLVAYSPQSPHVALPHQAHTYTWACLGLVGIHDNTANFVCATQVPP